MIYMADKIMKFVKNYHIYKIIYEITFSYVVKYHLFMKVDNEGYYKTH